MCDRIIPAVRSVTVWRGNACVCTCVAPRDDRVSDSINKFLWRSVTF